MTLWLAINGVLLLLAYLLGSLPTGYLAGRWLQGIDIREHGSGSTGATNVLRTLGKFPAIAVLLVDVLKGVLAIALVDLVYAFDPLHAIASWQPWMVTLAGLGAILGHSKSIWLNFKGGKSVATSLGILLAMSWQVGLLTMVVFGVGMAISRIVSLSSIAGAIALSGIMFLLGQPLAYELFAIAASLYAIWLHRSNIQRLLAGTEPKVGQKLSQPSEPSLES
ncbi:MAG: glycerol-3-phosphate 1-O-acyltransferase PlsY [Hormoscilla sp. GM7CHS1pb]|nr:glycerol-3-phosphate 1-O-acyltransferase PlsY [Hormoscilla sp. GM7CHS1pb]